MDVSFCTGIVKNSPPVGTGAAPPFSAGIEMTFAPMAAAPAFCQVPFSPKAKSPVWNSCHEVVCVFWITEFGA